MRFNLTIPVFALCTAVAIAALGVGPANASALIISHNGTTSSSPHSGTGEANVLLECGSQPQLEECRKTFFGLDQHEISWSGEGVFLETIINATGVPWTDFHFHLSGFTDVQGTVFGTCAAGTIFSIDCGTAQVEGTVDDLSVWLFFNEPFTPGTPPDTVGILWELEGSGTITQHPTTIPESGSLALFGLGLAGLGFARRWKTA